MNDERNALERQGWRWTCDLLKIEVTERQAEAMDELESRGLRFCADFGHQNAVAMAFGEDEAVIEPG